MEHKKFLEEIDRLRWLKEMGNTPRYIFKRWDSRRKLKRMIKRTAKKQSQLVYDQTVKLYNDILTSNLQK